MKENKSILYILPVFPVLSETFIIREINALISKGASIDIYALRKESSSHRISKNINVFYTNYLNIINKLLRITFLLLCHPIIYFKCIANCINELNNRNIMELIKDIRHLHVGILISSLIEKSKYKSIYSHWGTANTISAIVHQFTNLPYNICIHANELYTQTKIPFWIFDRARYIMVNNSYNVYYFNLVSNYKYSNKLYLVYNCPPEVPKEICPRKLISGRINMLSIGRLVYFKDHPNIIEACRIMKENDIDFRLTIAGSGESKDAINYLIKKYNLFNEIDLVGRYEPDEVWTLFKDNDILIHTSGIGPAGSRDGLPNVMIESMFAGLPIISTYISSIPELISNNKTGILIPEKNPYLLYEKIMSLYQNNELYANISNNSMEYIQKKFNARATADLLSNLLVE
mgnify:CR=1 FL=1|tara:strand:+ start:2336 stop:3544 length:1209 start_codon:yes stop_codon:yes gene_type:complete